MSQCMRCQHLAAKKALKRANGEFWNDTDIQVRVHVPWSTREIRKMRAMLYEGKTLKEIAAEIGRSVGSVNGASQRYMMKGWRDVQQLQRTAS